MGIPTFTLLLPCHSLEDFPTFHLGSEAENLLVTWTCPWHPAFLVRAQKLPSFKRVEDPPADCAEHVLLIPEVAKQRVPSGFLQRCSDQKGFAYHTSGDRSIDVQQIAAALEMSPAVQAVSAAVSAEFFALAYTYLQIEILTRQLRYSSNLDLVHFQSQVLKAAQAAVDGDNETMNLALDRCYDVLAEERHRYYPMDSFLVDLTLLASTTLGSRLQEHLQQSFVSNLLITTGHLQQLQQRDQATLDRINQRCQAGDLYLIGGCHNQAPTGLLSLETVSRNIRWGQNFADQFLHQPFRIFARRQPGLEITLPGPLRNAGYHGAIHQNFEDAEIPLGSHANFRWEGIDGQRLNSLTKTLCDAQQAGTFLKLGLQIGEALDIDHIAVTQLVHWPMRVSPIFYDLALSASRSNALGKWCTLDDVFAAIHDPGYSDSINANDYRSNYLGRMLSESGSASNLSGAVGSPPGGKSHSGASESEISAASATHEPATKEKPATKESDPPPNPRYSQEDLQQHNAAGDIDNAVRTAEAAVLPAIQSLVGREDRWRQLMLLGGMLQLASQKATSDLLQRLATRVKAIDDGDLPVNEASGKETQLDQARELLPFASAELDQWQRELSAELVQRLTAASPTTPNANAAKTALASPKSEASGLLLINHDPQVRRILVDAEGMSDRCLETVPIDQIYAWAEDAQGTWAVLDVPSLGYLHLPKDQKKRPAAALADKRAKLKILDGTSTLRNEFLSATIDSQTGALRSIHNYDKRKNLASLQLAWFDRKLQKQIKAALKATAGGDWRSNLAELFSRRDSADPRRKWAVHQGGYSAMKADRLETLVNNPIVAIVRTHGQLLLLDQAIADFQIDYQLFRGSRYLEIEAKITPVKTAVSVAIEKSKYHFPANSGGTDPASAAAVSEGLGNGYRRFFAWRLAHSQPSAEIFRDMNSMKLTAPRPRFEAPHAVEFIDQNRLSILCRGAAFHQIPADGKLDSVISHDDRQPTTTRYAIGLSPKNSFALSLSAACPVLQVPCPALHKHLPSAAWLFQCSSTQVLVTAWRNRYDATGFCGIDLRLLETTGRNRKFELEFALAAKNVTVNVSDPMYKPKFKCDGHNVSGEIGPWERLEVSLDF